MVSPTILFLNILVGLAGFVFSDLVCRPNLVIVLYLTFYEIPRRGYLPIIILCLGVQYNQVKGCFPGVKFVELLCHSQIYFGCIPSLILAPDLISLRGHRPPFLDFVIISDPVSYTTIHRLLIHIIVFHLSSSVLPPLISILVLCGALLVLYTPQYTDVLTDCLRSCGVTWAFRKLRYQKLSKKISGRTLNKVIVNFQYGK